MVERKTPFRGKREYVTFGDGFPGFGESDEHKALRWNADLFEEAPVSEPENAPVAYTGGEDFSTRGRYSGVGIIVDETGEFDPEPVRCGSAGPPCAETAWSLCWSRAPNLRAERTPSRSRPQVAPSRPPLRTTPNQRNLSRLSSTSRCFASSIEAVMGASSSSSIVRPVISPPSTLRSSCKLTILRFGCRRNAFRRPTFNRTNLSGEQ